MEFTLQEAQNAISNYMREIEELKADLITFDFSDEEINRSDEGKAYNEIVDDLRGVLEIKNDGDLDNEKVESHLIICEEFIESLQEAINIFELEITEEQNT